MLIVWKLDRLDRNLVQHEPRRRENRWVKRADHDDPDLTDLRVDPHNLYLWSPHRTMVDPLQHGATTYPFKVGLGARVYGIPRRLHLRCDTEAYGDRAVGLVRTADAEKRCGSCQSVLRAGGFRGPGSR